VAALDDLTAKRMFSGVHLLDGFHVLRNIRKVLEEKDHLLYFQKMMQAKNLGAFNWWLGKAKEKFSTK